MIVKSPLNYTGGKFSILPQILPKFPSNINNFIDLFGGGFNVGINARANQITYNEIITPLYDLMVSIYETTIDKILSHIESKIEEFNLSKNSKENYIKFREFYNKDKNPLDLYVLSRFSFNYQLRWNSSGNFNMPCGISDFSNNMKQNLKEFKYKMSQMNIKFSNKNFTDFDISGLTSDDMVYCDPPYLITTATYCDGKRGFEGWNEKYEKLLLQLLDKLNDMGVKFALSNVLSHEGKTNDILTEWHKKYNTYDIVKNYKTSNYQKSGKNNFETREVLITNYIPQIEHKKTLLDFISEL